MGAALGISVFVLLLPLAVHSQPTGKVWTIGFLAQATQESSAAGLNAFREGLRELGYAEKRNYILEVRFANGQTERLPALAADLVAVPVDVIVTPSTPSALAAMQTTRTVPIIIVTVADPVGSGLVQSFSRPGGNVTGLALALDEVSHKWLEFLRSVRGRLSHVAILQNSTNRSMPAMLGPLQASATALNVTLKVHDWTPSGRLERVIEALNADRPDGLVVLPDAFLQGERARIIEQLARLRLPAVYAVRADALAGGLMSYGPDFLDNYRRAGSYVDKVLNGARPGDLPVERPKKFELVVNMKTAKALRLTIPPALLLQADQVVE
jgi:putative ABC transport system substrate-binding protein